MNLPCARWSAGRLTTASTSWCRAEPPARIPPCRAKNICAWWRSRWKKRTIAPRCWRASAAKLPMVVYNIQGRSGVNIETATLKRLAEIENVVGVKEASGNIAQMASVIHQLPHDFAVLAGDDVVTIPLIALGGRGAICVVSNEIPREMTALTVRALAGDFAGAREILRKYLPLIEANGIETNPIPVKAAMALMGLLEPVWRLPLCPPSAASQA